MSDTPVTPRQSKRLAAAAKRKEIESKESESREPTETPRRSSRSKGPSSSIAKNLLEPLEEEAGSKKTPQKETKKPMKKRTSLAREASPVPPSPPKESEIVAKSRLSRLPVNRRRSSVCGPAMTLEDLAKSIPSEASQEEQIESLILLGIKYALQHGNSDDPESWKRKDRKLLNNQRIYPADLKKRENYQNFCQEMCDASKEKRLTVREEAEQYVEANNAEKERFKKLLSTAKEEAVESKNRFLMEDERQLENKRTQGYESLRAEVEKEMEEERAATAECMKAFEDNVARFNHIMDSIDRQAKKLEAQCHAADAKLEEFYTRYEESNQQDTPRTAIGKMK